MKASHIHRWLTAVIAVPGLFMLIYLGSPPIFSLLIGAVIVLAAWEYENMINVKKTVPRRWEFLFSALMIPLLTYHRDLGFLYVCTGLLTITLILCDLFRIRKYRESPDIGLLAKYILGLIYIPVLMSYFILIRGLETGTLWIFFILLLAFSGDVAAFYTGKFLGKTKLMPAISPNKTIEGVIGLVLGSMAACFTFCYFFFPALSVFHVLVIAFLGSIIGQLGDLFESEIKRGAGIKDSGSLLPGHGGILDRIDCLLFIAPFVYYYKVYIIS
jgi:phosphatidate cytidylyltransferase